VLPEVPALDHGQPPLLLDRVRGGRAQCQHHYADANT
jgi:hypothetical protein